MLLALLLSLSQTAAAPKAAPAPAPADPLDECLKATNGGAIQAEAAARSWSTRGGGAQALQCLGVALTKQERYGEAAAAFEQAAKKSEAVKDPHAADYWALAGNAWLGAGENEKALAALDTAIGSGVLSGSSLGETLMDRARVRVKTGDRNGARDDLDGAIANVPDDPFAWLLSATLWRKMDNLPRAQQDIKQALSRAPDSANVQLEQGYIAGWGGEDDMAKAAFNRVIELAPGSDLADLARKGLVMLGTGH